MSDEPQTESVGQQPPANKTPRRSVFKRFPIIVAAIVIGLAIIGGGAYYAFGREPDAVDNNFDPSSVLPAPVSQPEASAVYDADSLKEYTGKDGRRCYVAVDGVVYEITSKSLWQDGQHTPSGGEAYCGADLTEALKRSPHGASKLRDLPKVGTYKSS